MIKKNTKNRKKRQKHLNRLQALKYVILTGTICGLFVFQYQWFISATRIEVSYDFSNYLETKAEINDLEEYFEEVFIYVRNHPMNISAAEQSAFSNETIISAIEEKVAKTITTIQQIYEAYRNGTINELIYTFFEEMWNDAFLYFIPDEYFEPTKIILLKEGWASIANIEASLFITLNQRTARLLEEETNLLSSEDPLLLTFTLADLIHIFKDLAFNLLVEISIEMIEQFEGAPQESFFNYLEKLIVKSSCNADFNFGGDFGLLPISFTLDVNLNPLIRNIAKEKL